MSKYKYVDPIENGYTEFKLTKKQHNEIFKYRKRKWTDNYKYYYNDKRIIMHKFYNYRAVLVATLCFPVWVILNGLMSFKEICGELRDLYNQKESGCFTKEHVYGDRYDEIMKIVNEK